MRRYAETFIFVLHTACLSVPAAYEANDDGHISGAVLGRNLPGT